MPALSPTMTKGNIGVWKKSIGDSVSPGDLLVEIETDKATMDLEVQEEGFLAKILTPTGSKDVELGKPIAIFAEEKKDVKAFAEYPLDAAPQATNLVEDKKVSMSKASEQDQKPFSDKSRNINPASGTSSASSPLFASPAAKRVARELGVNLDSITTGSGPGNRILKEDVYNAASEKRSDTAKIQSSHLVSSPRPAVGVATQLEEFVDVPLTNMRKVIAQRLLESKSTIPHYYLTSNITMDKLLEVRSKLNQSQSEKISVNDFIIKAAALALMEFPDVNASFQGEFIRKYNSVDISVAVSTSSGLITPIIKKANTLGLSHISKTMKTLAHKAKEGTLTLAEFQGGTFTISNLGMFGSVESFSAIINPPQSAILAIGQSMPTIVPGSSSVDASIKVSQVMKVTLSCDHRVIDGALGAQWLGKFKSLLEDPLLLLL